MEGVLSTPGIYFCSFAGSVLSLVLPGWITFGLGTVQSFSFDPESANRKGEKCSSFVTFQFLVKIQSEIIHIREYF